MQCMLVCPSIWQPFLRILIKLSSLSLLLLEAMSNICPAMNWPSLSFLYNLITFDYCSVDTSQVPAVLSAVDVLDSPDEKAIMTYLAYFVKLDYSLRNGTVTPESLGLTSAAISSASTGSIRTTAVAPGGSMSASTGSIGSAGRGKASLMAFSCFSHSR